MTLNAKTEKRWWLWTPNWKAMMALNAKLKSDDGSERQNWKAMRALNAKLRRDDDDSERQTEDATLNVDLKTDDGSERRNWKATMMALNAETEKWWWWLWTSNWEVITTPNAETEDATLNMDMKIDDGSECRNWEVMMMTLNVKPRMRL